MDPHFEPRTLRLPFQRVFHPNLPPLHALPTTVPSQDVFARGQTVRDHSASKDPESNGPEPSQATPEVAPLFRIALLILTCAWQMLAHRRLDNQSPVVPVIVKPCRRNGWRQIVRDRPPTPASPGTHKESTGPLTLSPPIPDWRGKDDNVVANATGPNPYRCNSTLRLGSVSAASEGDPAAMNDASLIPLSLPSHMGLNLAPIQPISNLGKQSLDEAPGASSSQFPHSSQGMLSMMIQPVIVLGPSRSLKSQMRYHPYDSSQATIALRCSCVRGRCDSRKCRCFREKRVCVGCDCLGCKNHGA